MANCTMIDPDEALWDKARGLLAEELDVAPWEQVTDADRHYIEQHAPAYVAMLIAEEEEDVELYAEAHARLAQALGDSLPIDDDATAWRIARIVPIIVHAALEARAI